MTARQFTQVLLQSCRVQLKLLGRHWPARLSDLLMPAAVAFVPVLLAGAVAGGEAGSYFARRRTAIAWTGPNWAALPILRKSVAYWTRESTFSGLAPRSFPKRYLSTLSAA